MADATGQLLRIYEQDELGADGYPLAWHRCPGCNGKGVAFRVDVPRSGRTRMSAGEGICGMCLGAGSAKELIRRLAGNKCERCGHPFVVGGTGYFEEIEAEPSAEPDRLWGQFSEEEAERTLARKVVHWSPCAAGCSHQGPVRCRFAADDPWAYIGKGDWPLGSQVTTTGEMVRGKRAVEAAWRVLTVHHLNGAKPDLRWWNLASLCQRCHLYIQRKVVMERPFPFDHTEWFKLHAAGFYAWKYGSEELGREEVLGRLDELLALEPLALEGRASP